MKKRIALALAASLAFAPMVAEAKTYKIDVDKFTIGMPGWKVTFVCVEGVAFVTQESTGLADVPGSTVFVKENFPLCSEYNLAKLRKKFGGAK